MASDTLILLGAGASMDAGLPNMSGLVDLCRVEIAAEPRLAKVFDRLVRALRPAAPPGAGSVRTADLELLLEAIDTLLARRDHVLSAFVKERGWTVPGDERDLRKLRAAIRTAVRKYLDVSPARTSYLLPLVHLAQESAGMDVFSLNYDAAVEVACQNAGVNYTDGFDAGWNPALLSDTDRFVVRLHKLHGSLLWYSAGTGGLTKIPLRMGSFNADGSHIIGTRLEQVMIYPGPGKAFYSEPYADLMERFRLCLRTATLLVIIGCSLRDAHVRRAILEAARSNRRLRILVLDPNAASVLRTSDSLFPDDISFSSLPDRIIAVALGADVALRERLVLSTVSSVSRIDSAEATLRKMQRTEEYAAQRDAAAAVLRAAASGDAWGLVSQRCFVTPEPVFRDALLTMLVDGNPLAYGANLLLALLSAFDADHRTRAAARKLLDIALHNACQYGWEKDNLPIAPIGSKPDTLKLQQEDVERVLGAHRDSQAQIIAVLNRLITGGEYALSAVQLSTVRVIRERVVAVHTYLGEVVRAPQYPGAAHGAHSPRAGVPVAPGPAHIQLARTLATGIAFLPDDPDDLRPMTP